MPEYDFKPRINAEVMTRVNDFAYTLINQLEDFTLTAAMDTTELPKEFDGIGLNDDDAGEELLITEQAIVSMIISRIKREY